MVSQNSGEIKRSGIMQPLSAFCIIVIKGELLRSKGGEIDNVRQGGKCSRLD
jgi:hypothetical protein